MIKMRSDPYLARDSDVVLLETLRETTSKIHNSRAGSKAYIDAMKKIDTIVASLQQYPIHDVDRGVSDGSSCSSTTSNTPEKEEEDEIIGYKNDNSEIEVELESGQGVFVEAASVTICHALPSDSKISRTLKDTQGKRQRGP